MVNIPENWENKAKLYLEQRKSDLKSLEKCLERNDFMSIHFFSQHIMGSARQFGFQQLMIHATQLELGAAQENKGSLKKEIKKMKTHLYGIRLDPGREVDSLD